VKYEENVAARFLVACFGTQPEYEPLGRSRPPDFALGSSGFEVRRLNQHVIGGEGEPEGLENISISLARAIARELDQIPYSPTARSYFWGVSFKRPLEQEIRRIVAKIGQDARSLYSSKQHLNGDYRLRRLCHGYSC